MKRIFVYGSLKKGYSNHSLLADCKYLGEHVTENEYTMIDFGPFPAVVEGGFTPITGEVYEISTPVSHSIDRLEGYPYMYNRKRIDTEYGKALVYFMEDVSHYFEKDTPNVIESGVWGNE